MWSWAGSLEADTGARLCVKGVDSESSQGRQAEEERGSRSGKGRRPGQGEASSKNLSHWGCLLGSQCAHRWSGGRRARGGGAGAKRADCVLPNSMLRPCGSIYTMAISKRYNSGLFWRAMHLPAWVDLWQCLAQTHPADIYWVVPVWQAQV